MNTLEKKMTELLKDLRDNHQVVEVKAEFEAEASRMNEVMRLKEIAEKVGLGLVVKIGGCEAISDMFQAQHLGITGLIAPMIESSYALSKFLIAIKKYFPRDLRREIYFGVNVETEIAYNNFDKMLKLEMIKLIDTVTVGRVDLSSSLGLGRNDINCDKVYGIVEDIYKKAKRKKMRTTLGGGIAVEAIPFIKKLIDKKLLDRFETRKIVFNTPKKLNRIEEGIIKANKFELLWLENKKKHYGGIYREDMDRIKMLRRRITF